MAIFGEAEKCHKDQTKQQCPFHPAPAEEPAGKKKGCCDEEHELVKIDDQKQPVVDAIPAIVAVLPDLPLQLFNYQPPNLRLRKRTAYENYHPPPLVTDVAREFQVFRL